MRQASESALRQPYRHKFKFDWLNEGKIILLNVLHATKIKSVPSSANQHIEILKFSAFPQIVSDGKVNVSPKHKFSFCEKREFVQLVKNKKIIKIGMK